jgi:YihY family inner membrane protein
MPTPAQCAENILRRPGRFFWRVLQGFRRNQGILLSGAVAYYMLLSMVPLLALLLVGLSHVYSSDALLATLSRELHLAVPSLADALTGHIAGFLAHKGVVGGVGTLVLVFFSTMAFTVLENAMSVIFFHRVAIQRRHYLVSAVIPFLFIALIGGGLLVVTVISGVLQSIEGHTLHLLGHTWDLRTSAAVLLYLVGVVGLVLLLTALYLVMPVGRIAPRRALLGGVVAGVLWEVTRHVLVWYFTTLSLVNMVYGSLASVVVVLLSFEAAAIILLFGAQVIAEFERCSLDIPAGQGNGFHT